jgi:hypothetical protein
MPLGVVLGFVTGLRADLGWGRHGEYGAEGEIPFEAVFDPTEKSYGRPPIDTVQVQPGQFPPPESVK